MLITIIKGAGADEIKVGRTDGSQIATRLPHKGPVPHDAVHFFVEQGLGLSRAFWGLVAEGHHPEHIAAMAREAGHASAKRGEVPAAEMIEAIQAERIVEAFEADLWSSGGDPQSLRDMAQSGCWQSHVAMPEITDDEIEKIRKLIGRFREDWIALPLGSACELSWQSPRRQAG